MVEKRIKAHPWYYHVMTFDPEEFNLQYVLEYQNPKKKRRTKIQIKRVFKCDFLDCKKAYGRSSHLAAHKKMKNHTLLDTK